MLLMRKYYYMQLLEIKKDFNVLIDNKLFFDQLVKKKQDLHEKLLKMSRKDDYATGSLLNYFCHQNIINSLA